MAALMAKTPKRPRDLNQWAKRMVDIATGDIDDRSSPLCRHYLTWHDQLFRKPREGELSCMP
jgi:hypothetical protein